MQNKYHIKMNANSPLLYLSSNRDANQDILQCPALEVVRYIYKYCFLNENGKFKDAMPVSFNQK